MCQNINLQVLEAISSSQKNYIIQEKDWKKSQNKNNNECLKRGLARNFHPADKHPARIRKIEKDFLRKLHFKYIKKSQSWEKQLHQH